MNKQPVVNAARGGCVVLSAVVRRCCVCLRLQAELATTAKTRLQNSDRIGAAGTTGCLSK